MQIHNPGIYLKLESKRTVSLSLFRDCPKVVCRVCNIVGHFAYRPQCPLRHTWPGLSRLKRWVSPLEELRNRREGKGRHWFFGYLMQLEGERGVIVRQSFKKRLIEIWWDLNLRPSDNWFCTLPLANQDRWKKNFRTYIWWIFIQLRIFLGQQLKLNWESAKKIMTTFAFRYLLYGVPTYSSLHWTFVRF